MDNAQKIWDRLISAGLTPAGAAGLMGNLYAESGLRPDNLQNTCEAKLGFTDAGYTVAVDNGCYANFARDRAGYGIAQWSYPTRKAALLAFARAQSTSIGDLDMQVSFLLQELQTLFPAVWAALQRTASVTEATVCVLTGFERPADQSEAVKARRTGYAQMFYDQFVQMGGSGLKLLKCLLTASDCYKAGQTIKPKGVMVHSTGANNPNLRRYVQPIASTPDRANLLAQLGTNGNGNHWNQTRVYVYTDGTRTVGTRNRSKTLKQVLYEPCVHGFVGKLADGSVAAVQTLPWNHRGWHAGTGTSGKSANDTHISFEICEDGLSDPAYFKQVYQTAVELTAMLCKEYGLDPLADGVVICHQEGYRRGVASNHGDVLHWFPKHGKSMNEFRADVAKEMGMAGKPMAPALAPAAGYDKAKDGTYIVTPAVGLNIRAGAGTDKAVLGTLTKGTQVVCYGYYSTTGGVDWLLVTASGITGYVSSAYLRAEAVPPVDSSNDINNKEDNDMVIYEKLGDVADSYKPTIRKLMERGALRGYSDPDPNSLEDNVLNVDETYCRVMTSLDRMGKLD